MGLAAVISLLRGFVVAGTLPQSDFGLYALVFAIGSFASNFLGFGQIEDSRKHFPRMMADNDGALIPGLADRIIRLILLRAGATTAIASALFAMAGRSDLVIFALGCTLVAFSGGCASITVSAHRSTGAYGSLAASTVIRAVASLLLAVIGAVYAGWKGAIVGEFAGSIIGAVVSRHYVRRYSGTAPSVAESATRYIRKSAGGIYLFLAIAAASAPYYLDRFFVTMVYGKEEAGTYAFLMLFVTAASVTIGIFDQMLGPHLVRMQNDGETARQQMKYSLNWIAAFAILVGVGMLVAASALFSGPLAFLSAKYNLTSVYMLAVCGLCILQISTTLDWILQSHNQERRAMFAAFAYLSIVLLIAQANYKFSAGLPMLIWGLAFAKLCHIAMQIFLIWFTDRQTAKSDASLL